MDRLQVSKRVVLKGRMCPRHNTRLKDVKTRGCYECRKMHKRDWARRRRNRDRTMSLVYSRLRRQRMLESMPRWADRAKIAAVYARREPGQHVDHIVPLKGIDRDTGEHVVCGLHVHYNLRITSGKTNDAKWAYWRS